jgi:uncharacterized protein YbjT (DUF2867 family)
MKNIFITGANGFIGQALCKRLMADGYQVRGAVRSAAQMTALPSWVEGAMVGNIGPETDWGEALKGIEGILQLGCMLCARALLIRLLRSGW